jgi:hypothetical protein
VFDPQVQILDDVRVAQADAQLFDHDAGHDSIPDQPLTAPAAMPRTNQRPETR